MDDLTKRLIASMHIGVMIKNFDGHRYIVTGCQCGRGTELDESIFNNLVEKGCVVFPDKIYGSVIDALDCVDRALELIGHDYYRSLLCTYDLVYKDNEQESVTDVGSGDMDRVDTVRLSDIQGI